MLVSPKADLLKGHPHIMLNYITPSERDIKAVLEKTGKFSPEDELNCGACGNGCGRNQVCVDGACACLAGTLCDGRCVNLDTNPLNCGVCGNACGESQVCASGECTCPWGASECSGADGVAFCAYLLWDPANCGACGRSCPQGDFCLAGICF